MILSCPTPVVRPQMDIAIIYIPVGTNALPAIQLAFTAPLAFTSDGDEMILVERTDQTAAISRKQATAPC